jgi:acetolactate decarboxylase
LEGVEKNLRKPNYHNAKITNERGHLAAKKRYIAATVIVLAVIISLGAFYEVWQVQPCRNERTLFQVSPFNTFSEGNFDGNTTYAELAKQGDFGIGTLDGLNGEMIALDGIFYQIPSNGTPRQIGTTEETPYATVTFFEPTLTLQNAGSMNYSQMVTYINGTLPNHGAIYAIKIHGVFSYAKTRSPPLQTPPYPNLTEALRNQSVFTLSDTQGTAVGFYFPNSLNGVDSVGFHLHYITDNRDAGGHLLDCTAQNVTIQIEQINNYRLAIP